MQALLTSIPSWVGGVNLELYSDDEIGEDSAEEAGQRVSPQREQVQGGQLGDLLHQLDESQQVSPPLGVSANSKTTPS